MTALLVDVDKVSAEPFRAHLGILLDRTGLPWPVLALKAQVEPVLVRRLLFGDGGRQLAHLPAEAARALFELDERSLLAAGRRWVPARAARADLGRLLADGLRPAALARYCRLSQTELRAVLGSSRCLELTALLARSARIQFAALAPAAIASVGGR